MGKKKSSHRIIHILPDDVVNEILPRLAVKSLVRFKCVSKSWSCFISSHYFSKTYLHRHSKTQHGFILTNCHELMFKHFSLPCKLLNEPPKDLLFDANHVVEQFIAYMFVGSCDGLVCIKASIERPYCSSTNHIVLWNPSTRETKRLPDFGEEPDTFPSYGFGFDESCDDYKVVAFYASNSDTYDVVVKIFRLKTGELKKIKNHCGRWTRLRPPRCVKGKLHWIAETKLERDVFIAYLDLTTEEYGIIDKPDFVILDQLCLVKAVSRESLYVICHFDNNVTNVWLVDPCYGVGKTTWSKVYSISGFNDPGAYLRYEYLLFVLENGEIVFLLGNGKIEIFNPADCSVRYQYPELGTSKYNYDGIGYVESLVSPHCW